MSTQTLPSKIETLFMSQRSSLFKAKAGRAADGQRVWTARAIHSSTSKPLSPRKNGASQTEGSRTDEVREGGFRVPYHLAPLYSF